MNPVTAVIVWTGVFTIAGLWDARRTLRARYLKPNHPGLVIWAVAVLMVLGARAGRWLRDWFVA